MSDVTWEHLDRLVDVDPIGLRDVARADAEATLLDHRSTFDAARRVVDERTEERDRLAQDYVRVMTERDNALAALDPTVIAAEQAEVEALRAERDRLRGELERLMDATVIVKCEHPEIDGLIAERDLLLLKFGTGEVEIDQLREDLEHVRGQRDEARGDRDRLHGELEAHRWRQFAEVQRLREAQALLGEMTERATMAELNLAGCEESRRGIIGRHNQLAQTWTAERAELERRQGPVVEAARAWRDSPNGAGSWVEGRALVDAVDALGPAAPTEPAPEARRTWTLPPEPGLEVTRVMDQYGQHFERQHGEHPGDDLWSGTTFAGDADVPDLELEWPMLMAYQAPLTDATPPAAPAEED